MFSKKGIEVATNTIVTLIVGVIVFTLGLGLTYGAFCGAADMALDVDAQSQNQMERLLSTGSKVEIADNTKTIQRNGNILCGGSAGYSAEFILGIKTGDNDVYNVSVAGLDSGMSANVFQPGTLPANTQHVTKILVTSDRPITEQVRGTVTVNKSNSIYGVQLIYINPE